MAPCQEVQDSEFFFPLIRFKLDDGTLFRVPNKPFLESEVFRKAYNLPQSADNTVYTGIAQDGIPLVFAVDLKGIRTEDFRCLLKVLFHPPGRYRNIRLGSSIQWMAVLQLAQKWELSNVVEIAVGELRFDPGLSSVTRLDLARKHRAFLDMDGWVRRALETLCERAEPLSRWESMTLGCRLALDIARVREGKQQRYIKRMEEMLSRGGKERYKCGDCGHIVDERPDPSKCPVCEVRNPMWHTVRAAKRSKVQISYEDESVPENEINGLVKRFQNTCNK